MSFTIAKLFLASALAALTAVDAYDNGLGEYPILGWNTWCTDDVCGLIDHCFEKEILEMADAMTVKYNGTSLYDLGYRYINLDDCWSAETRDDNGNLQADPELFPNGMGYVADYLHKLDLKLGIYTCVGTYTCKYKRPGSYNYWKQDAMTLAKWGVDLVKADNCYAPKNETEQDLYGNFSAALNATGHPMLFSLCNWGESNVQDWGADVGQQFRIQMDHLPFWEIGTHAAGEGYGQGVLDIIRYVGTVQPETFVKAYGYMDPDFLMTLFPVTMPEAASRTEFSFWALWSSPLVTSTDIRNMTQQKIDILMNEEVIAIQQDPSHTAGQFVASFCDGGEIWYKSLHNGDKAVILLNPDWHNSQNVSVTWEQIGLDGSDSLVVRDLWAHKTLGSFTEGITRLVPAQDVFMFTASEQSQKQQP